MIGKAKLIYNTIKHLKPVQVFYQLKYRIIKVGYLGEYSKKYDSYKLHLLTFVVQPPIYSSYLGNNLFSFLNQNVQFKLEINWNYLENGKLWNYNLQYANWLLQEDLNFNDKINLLQSLYRSLNDRQVALEPYPASLRVINVIRLFSLENKQDYSILKNTYAELDFISKKPEYHLLGNHLLENAFALIMGGAFFTNNKWVDQAESILKKELEEQILSDGAHFELSPMYHQIILFRLLELIDWYNKYPFKENSFNEFIIAKAGFMLAWLKNISFGNGNIPHFNDSTEGIAYSSDWLISYAEQLGVKSKEIPFGASGYRSVKKPLYECKIDFAQIGPSYQPGHAHSDALSFILYHNNKPLFVEQGTSTYQIGERRILERSTSSHNTVIVCNKNQSNVWSAFRVAERARTTILNDSPTILVAGHDGYNQLGAFHKRSFEFKENSIQIIDNIDGSGQLKQEFHLHIAPQLTLKHIDNTITITNICKINFIGCSNIRIEDYQMANGFNLYSNGKKIIVDFSNQLTTDIHFN